MATGTNLIPTVIGFGMSATFIVFVCTRLICGRMRRDEARPMFELGSRIDVEQVMMRTHFDTSSFVGGSVCGIPNWLNHDRLRF